MAMEDIRLISSWRRIPAVVLLCCMLIVLSLLSGCAGNKGLEVNEETFPDAALREAVLAYDQDNDGTLSDEELQFVVFLGLGEEEYVAGAEDGLLPQGGIPAAALDGVEQLTSLKAISLTGEADSLEISGPDSLEAVFLPDSNYAQVSLGGCKGLKCASARSSSLTHMSVSDVTSLETLRICASGVQELPLDGCVGLKRLYLEGTPVAELDLAPCPSLEVLECDLATTVSNMPSSPANLSEGEQSTLLGMVECLAAAGQIRPVGSDVLSGYDDEVRSDALYRAQRDMLSSFGGKSGSDLWPKQGSTFGSLLSYETGKSLYDAFFSDGFDEFCKVDNGYFEAQNEGWAVYGADDPVGYSKSISNLVSTPRGIEFDLALVREGAMGIVKVTYWHAVARPSTETFWAIRSKALSKCPRAIVLSRPLRHRKMEGIFPMS